MTTTFINFLESVESNPTTDRINAKLIKYYPNLTIKKVFKSVFDTKLPVKTSLMLLPRIFKVLDILYPNRGTLSGVLSAIRKKIKETQPESVYTKSKLDTYFNMNEADRLQKITKYQETIANKNSDLIQIDKTQLLKKIEELKTSKNVYSIGVLLMLNYGGRPMDLFKNTVELIPNKPNHIKISNLAKDTKGDKSVVRPIINLTADDFVNRLKGFRKYFANKTIYEEDRKLSSHINAELSKATKKAFPDLIGSQTSSMLRKYYCVLAYEIYADKKKENFNLFIKKILGHESSATSFSYSTVNLNDEPEQEAKDEQDEKTPETPQVNQTYEKLSRLAPIAEKMALLDKIYRDNNNSITNVELRKLSGMGSRIVNDFLSSR
jgi:integrase